MIATVIITIYNLLATSYIDSRELYRPNTWGSELEMICLSHMLNTIVYSFEANSNTWQVFSYKFVDQYMTCDYT